MRESRSSGSVEGVMGNHDSYSDSFCRVPHSGRRPEAAAARGAERQGCRRHRRRFGRRREASLMPASTQLRLACERAESVSGRRQFHDHACACACRPPIRSEFSLTEASTSHQATRRKPRPPESPCHPVER
jgi:hypothetical protein